MKSGLREMDHPMKSGQREIVAIVMPFLYIEVAMSG